MNVLRRVLRLDRRELALLAAALVLLARVRMVMWLLPWRRTLPLAHPPCRRAPPRFGAERVEWAIRSASRAVPHATCLTQALALNHLLRREGHAATVQIGVLNDRGRFTAHAWVENAGVPLLSGAGELNGYSRLFSWPPPQPDSA